MGRTKKGIKLTGAEVRAIICGRKRQLRRVVEPQPAFGLRPYKTPRMKVLAWEDSGGPNLTTKLDKRIRCPYGAVGDILRVQEIVYIAPPGHSDDEALSRTDYKDEPRVVWYDACMTPGEEHWDDENKKIIGMDLEGVKRCRADLMPKWAGRIEIKIIGIYAQKIQDITVEECMLDLGVAEYDWDAAAAENGEDEYGVGEKALFSGAWDGVYDGTGFEWNDNPWVWVMQFEVVALDTCETCNEQQTGNFDMFLEG